MPKKKGGYLRVLAAKMREKKRQISLALKENGRNFGMTTNTQESTSRNNEVSDDDGGSLQRPHDAIFINEGTECIMDTSINNEVGDKNGGSSQGPRDDIFENVEIECVMVPKHEETTIDIVPDEILGEPKTKKPLRSQQSKNKQIAIRDQKIALRDQKIATLSKKIAVQNKNLENQDKRIATQDRLIAKQEKTIQALREQIVQLELKNFKLTKRNEFLRGSVQRLREKILTTDENDLQPI